MIALSYILSARTAFLAVLGTAPIQVNVLDSNTYFKDGSQFILTISGKRK